MHYRTIVSSLHGLLRGKIRPRPGKLNDERLHRPAAGLDADSKVGEQLEGVRANGGVPNPQHVQFHLVGGLGIALLPFEPADSDFIPLHSPVGPVGRLGVLGNLGRGLLAGGLGFGIFRLGDRAHGKTNRLGTVNQRRVRVPIILDGLIRVFHRAHDAAGDFLRTAEPAKPAHPLVGRLAVHQVRRLVAGRPRPAQHAQPGTESLPQRLAHRVPEVGVYCSPSLDFLRRARDVHGHADQLSRRVPKEQRAHVTILVALQIAKLGQVGAAVHSRRAVGIHGTAIVGHRGVAESPSHAARPAALPCPGDGAGNTFHQEGPILLDLHDPLFGNLVFVRQQDGGRVRVRAVEKDLHGVQIRQTLLHFLANHRQNLGRDVDQVARDHDRQVLRLLARSRLDGNHAGRHRRLDLAGDSQMKLAGNGHRSVGGDVHFGRADEEFRGECSRRQNRHCEQGTHGCEKSITHQVHLPWSGSIVWRTEPSDDQYTKLTPVCTAGRKGDRSNLCEAPFGPLGANWTCPLFGQ